MLLRGASGAGKSDLALRLLAEGFVLVADDRVRLAAGGGALLASAPGALAGLIEVRGLGIVRLAHRAEARVALVADLVSPGLVERLPEPALCRDYPGAPVALVRLHAFEASAPRKLALALAAATGRLAVVAGAFGPNGG